MARKIGKKIMKVLEDNNAGFAAGCIEPGYDDKPVILANWNNIPAETFDKLESMGYSCEWEDEWLECGECYKAFRCSPDSYCWEMYGIITDGDCICGECLKESPEEYLESLENIPERALMCSLFQEIDPAEHGYSKVRDGFENGFHIGMNDDPKKILTDLLAVEPSGRFIFVITEQSQFYITFAVYQRTPEED